MNGLEEEVRPALRAGLFYDHKGDAPRIQDK